MSKKQETSTAELIEKYAVMSQIKTELDKLLTALNIAGLKSLLIVLEHFKQTDEEEKKKK